MTSQKETNHDEDVAGPGSFFCKKVIVKYQSVV